MTTHNEVDFGVNPTTEVDYLVSRTHWQPYLVILHEVEGQPARVEERKLDMKGRVLWTRQEALSWLTNDLPATHPEIEGMRVDIMEEPWAGTPH